MHYTIHIEDLRFKCIIGILDFERKKPQEVIIDAQIDYNFDYGFIDYAKVAKMLKKKMQKKKFYLLEDAHYYFFKKLKKKYPYISALKLKITKPSILPDCRVAIERFKQFDS